MVTSCNLMDVFLMSELPSSGGYSLKTLPYLTLPHLTLPYLTYIMPCIAPDTRAGGGAPEMEVDYPPSQPVGSRFEPH